MISGFWVGGGHASAPAIITVWSHCTERTAAKLQGPWVPFLGAVPGSSSVAGLVGESSPISPMQCATLQHPHYPHSSKGSPEQSVTSHKRLYWLVCRSVSRGPLYLSASSSVMKRPSAGRVSRLPAAGISSSSHQDFN